MKNNLQNHSERFSESVANITDTLRRLAFLETIEIAADTTIRQQSVMRQVYQMTRDKPEGVLLRELAKSLKLTSGTVSELVESLVRKGGLVREQNPLDRRAILIRLSDESIRCIVRGLARKEEIVDTLLEEIAPDQRESVIGLLEKISRKVSEMKGE